MKELSTTLQTEIEPQFSFSVSCKYNNCREIAVAVDEISAVRTLASQETLSSDAREALATVTTIREVPDSLNSVHLAEPDEQFLAGIQERIEAAEWNSVLGWEAWQWLNPRMPRFLYFGDYNVLPSKMNLTDLMERAQRAPSDAAQLQQMHRGVLALLRMADIEIEDFASPGGYETLKAKIEGVSINLTDQIMEFWKQNEDLEVEIDIKPDPDDQPPYNSGPNLYLRIKNRRHRGVSTPFRQRSRGFIWFFSFLVWFHDIKHQLASAENAVERNLILLLDEPALSLHALAQQDFLAYIDKLAKRHQILYTTHSPFMVQTDHLERVRTVEDRDGQGTVISADLQDSNTRTLFPLQSALGWTVAQNLFVSKRNLVVEGTSELVYLQTVSALLEKVGKTGLRGDVTIVPAGGLDKVVTFIALLGASGLELGVLHDYRGRPEQKLVDLVKEKVIAAKAILNVSEFRDVAHLGRTSGAADIEDLLSPSLYLKHFKAVFEPTLKGKVPTEKALPRGRRIVERIERWLEREKLQTRPSGGFNHLRVASHFASQPPTKLDDRTTQRFEALFVRVNGLFRK